MKKIKTKLLIALCLLGMSSSFYLQAQTEGQPVTRKFVNKRTEPIMLYVAKATQDGHQTIKDSIKIDGFKRVNLNVGDYVWAELIDDKYQKTDKIFINGTRSESQDIELYPQHKFLTFLGELGNNGQSNRFLGNAYNYYGVQIEKYSPRRVIDAFQPFQIFKAFGGELTPSETRSYYLQIGTGTLMPVGFIYTGADSRQKGSMTVSEYHSMKSFKKNWNVTAGLAGKHPKGVGGSVDFSYGENFEKTQNQSNVFYLKQQSAAEYGVSVNIEKAEFDDDFIAAIAAIKTPAQAEKFVNDYGTHYPKAVTYGGLYSQYTSVSKNDFYEAKSKNLSIKAAVDASKSKPDQTYTAPNISGGNTKTSVTGNSKSVSGSVGYSQTQSQELKRILSNSSSNYTAIGGSITSNGEWTKEGTQTAVAVELELITDLIDAKILKSRYTEEDLKGIRKLVDDAVKNKMKNLKNYAEDKPERFYKMQISQIRITRHKDDTKKDGKGFIRAKVIGAEKGRDFEKSLFEVADFRRGFNKDWEIHFADDNEENPGTRRWHYFSQKANDDGSFPELSVDFKAEIWDKDICCGDEVATVKWGEKATGSLIPNEIYEHVMRFKDKDVLPLQDWEIEATILIVPVDPSDSLKDSGSATRSSTVARPSNTAEKTFTPPTMTQAEFEALATAKSKPSSSSVANTTPALNNSSTKATPKTSEVNKTINGRNVKVVNFSKGSYEQYDAKTWHEKGLNGKTSFVFEETGRDEWSVFLLDKKRNTYIMLNLWKKDISYKTSASANFRKLYNITASK